MIWVGVARVAFSWPVARGFVLVDGLEEFGGWIGRHTVIGAVGGGVERAEDIVGGSHGAGDRVLQVGQGRVLDLVAAACCARAGYARAGWS